MRLTEESQEVLWITGPTPNSGAALYMTMNLLSYIPPPPLSEFVDLFWLVDGPAPAHGQERLLPTGTTELVIDIRESSRRDVPLLCGPHSKSFVVDTEAQAGLMGVHFKPGGAFPFFKTPAGELHNVVACVDTLWGGRAAQLRERLLEAPTPLAKFQTLESFLLTQAVRPLVRHPAVDFALRAFWDVSQSPSISVVVDRTGWSHRRFIEVFRHQVGLAPKLFCRVVRFQHLLQLIQHQRQLDWSDVAVACGYYDQAHFIDEFRDFSGLSPTAYLQVRGEHLNHVPLAN